MWLAKLTPAGLLHWPGSQLRLRARPSLMEGNIELAQEKLTTYSQEHDADITLEQASYLADCSMKALKAAGRIVMHQVAARGFKAIRKETPLIINSNATLKQIVY